MRKLCHDIVKIPRDRMIRVVAQQREIGPWQQLDLRPVAHIPNDRRNAVVLEILHKIFVHPYPIPEQLIFQVQAEIESDELPLAPL